MDFDRALEILEENKYKVIEHEGWGEYEVRDEYGENVSYGGETMDEDELVKYVESYLM